MGVHLVEDRPVEDHPEEDHLVEDHLEEDRQGVCCHLGDWNTF